LPQEQHNIGLVLDKCARDARDLHRRGGLITKSPKNN
jgi:hypothetical protein